MFQGSIIATLLGLTSTLLWAQADQQVLQEVVVSGSRTETKLSETPVSIGAVSRDKWDADKPKNVGEIINRIPGVFWNDLGNEQHSMGIRQPISTNSVYQYLEDGIPIRPLGVFNHNALNETNVNGSAGVEVVKGAASSLYGSNAVGGAGELFEPGTLPHANRHARPALRPHRWFHQGGFRGQQYLGRLGIAVSRITALAETRTTGSNTAAAAKTRSHCAPTTTWACLLGCEPLWCTPTWTPT